MASRKRKKVDFDIESKKVKTKAWTGSLSGKHPLGLHRALKNRGEKPVHIAMALGVGMRDGEKVQLHDPMMLVTEHVDPADVPDSAGPIFPASSPANNVGDINTPAYLTHLFHLEGLSPTEVPSLYSGLSDDINAPGKQLSHVVDNGTIVFNTPPEQPST